MSSVVYICLSLCPWWGGVSYVTTHGPVQTCSPGTPGPRPQLGYVPTCSLVAKEVIGLRLKGLLVYIVDGYTIAPSMLKVENSLPAHCTVIHGDFHSDFKRENGLYVCFSEGFYSKWKYNF